MKFEYEVKIPKERVAVLVGTKGNIKKLIEAKLKIKLLINSKTGDVNLEGEDSLDLVTGQNIVKAIGRGFNPEFALDLLNENIAFEVIDMTEYTGDSAKSLVRVRARAIGTGGKARTYIEKLTDTKIVIFGKTVGIIGNYENVGLARKAFDGLLLGQRHATVYSWLEKHRKNIKYKMY